MKAKVIQRFYGVVEDHTYEVGKTFVGKPERVAELAAKGFVLPIEEKPDKEKRDRVAA